MKLRRKQVRSKCVIDPVYEEVNNAFERSLVFMHKVIPSIVLFSCRIRILFFLAFQMPRIWLDYCQFLIDQGKITRTRRVFDRSIRALPITQHNRIWPLYIKFVTSYTEISETAMRVYKRYLKVRRKQKRTIRWISFDDLVTTRMCRRIYGLST